LLALITSLLRSPKLDEQQLDEDAEEAEEEALLSGSRRNMDDRWQSIVGRASRSEDT
jgi:LMBR1 domain-containing protein 1